MSKDKQSWQKRNWDKHNSTFMQRILMSNGMEFIGYSKKIGCNERNDKNSLLSNWILRTYKDGYLDPVNEVKTKIDGIEYYHIPSGEHFLTLHYAYADFVSDFIEGDEWQLLRIFFKRFYEMVEQKITPLEIYDKLYVKARQRSKMDMFDMSRKRFQTPNALQHYVSDLIIAGKATNEAAEDFIRKYSEKYFEGKVVIRSKELKSIGDLIENSHGQK